MVIWNLSVLSCQLFYKCKTVPKNVLLEKKLAPPAAPAPKAGTGLPFTKMAAAGVGGGPPATKMAAPAGGAGSAVWR